jgi:pyruvate,water dikinase
MAVGCLLMVRARSSGVIYTIDPAAPEGEALLVTACPGLGVTVVEGRGPVDRFEVSRSPPHRVLRRALADKAEMCIAAPGGGVGMAPVPPEQRRAPAVCDDELAALADAALRIERHMKAPQDIEWALTADGGVQVLQARALQITAPAPERIEELRAARARYRVLMQGSGDVACRGVGIGRVSVVGADETAKGFCPGDVLVSRSASPKLSPLVARASAVVCELGAVTGHLATVARELRVPTLVNVRDATRILVPGTTVTVDADENAIYEGSAEELLRYQLVKGGSFEETAEFRVLRRILKHAAPLYLRDPGASSFAPESCRTYHDIIRFVHERALTELRRVGEVKGCSSDLDLEVPLDLCVVDVGGGTAPERSRGPLRLADVASRPLRAVLEGVLMPGAWATSPADMDLEGFMASATRASPLTMAAVKRNVAIVSSDYLNLNLRLGYHFNVVDAYLGQAGGEDSYVYFRFVGGVTEVSRRARRARLLATILAHYEFRTEQEGELVIGRLQGVGASLCAERLRMIGRLIGFSRQLDIFLRDDAIADKLVSKFLEGGHEVSSAGEEERAMANRTEVLVLDDEPIVGERLKEFLEKKGMSVETFTDSREALGRLGEKQFQVVVTDLKMKGPSGLEVLLEVKNRRLPTEVIVITGYRSIEAAREAECVGAFGFVDKPFRLEALHDLVAKAAKRSRQPRPSELPE